MSAHQQLQRRLGTLDATAIGLGSMLGAGVFVVFAPAAALAGQLLALSVVIAGAVAYCNAVASAALAAKYPTSGGTYVYGREQLGEWPGFLAGWGFVTGKTASCAAMALTFGSYIAPDYPVPVAVAAVIALTGVNLLGITRTALLTRILLCVVLATLVFVALAAAVGPHPAGGPAESLDGAAGVLPAAGLMFFAFAGYARIATLGEEVKDPARAIPRAVLAALAGAFAIYLTLALLLLNHLPGGQLAATTTPLLDAVMQSRLEAGAPLVQVGAGAACLGALLALITGVGRTTLAMARERDLPGPLAKVGGKHTVPFVAELAVAAVVILLLVSTDVMTVVGVSSFGVLIYYAVANASAYALDSRPGYAPRWLNAVGFLACLLLAFTLPPVSVLTMVAVLGAGAAGRWAALRFRGRQAGRG
ncbi:APC family permease [Pseudarthrobacter sp. NamE5]|uniref:APC family permease n=1 Tax=Pseudarthrobacter sp. NamE5 TaxID=2576839 RepID=UPI00110BAE4D|nr:APC family permease [Pseudarthrobacter sp. NamE5]TLM87548.1 amino acid permease [Pseudarthrobacter sp. NamE5]